MTISSTMAALMDAVRNEVGTNEKMTIVDSTNKLKILTSTTNELLKMPVVTYLGKIQSELDENVQSLKFDNENNFLEILPQNSLWQKVSKGDVLKQSFLLESNVEFNRFTISFFGSSTGHHLIESSINQIKGHLYKISASYTAKTDESIRLLDLYEVDVFPYPKNIVLKFSQPFVGIISEVGGVNRTFLFAFEGRCAA